MTHLYQILDKTPFMYKRIFDNTDGISTTQLLRLAFIERRHQVTDRCTVRTSLSHNPSGNTQLSFI